MDELTRDNLTILNTSGGLKWDEPFFAYTSGSIGPNYVSSESVTRDSNSYYLAIRSMQKVVERWSVGKDEKIEYITGGQSRDWLFSEPLARKLGGVTHVRLFKNGDVEKNIDMEGKTVIHVADLNNEGHSIRNLWIPLITQANGNLGAVFFYVDRMEEGNKALNRDKITHDSVVKLDSEVWDYMLREGVVDEDSYRNIMARREDPNGWAERMLKSDKGLEHLITLLKNPHLMSRAWKVVNEGYPSMTPELTERLEKRGYVNPLSN